MINFYGKKQRRYCVNICNTDYYIKEDIDFERKRKNRKIKSGDECVESRLEYGSKTGENKSKGKSESTWHLIKRSVFGGHKRDENNEPPVVKHKKVHNQSKMQ